nr:MAG TPA: Type II secretion system, protein M [Caudoviricetes sp.]
MKGWSNEFTKYRLPWLRWWLARGLRLGFSRCVKRKRQERMKNYILGILNIAALVIVLVVCCVNMNARIVTLEERTKELQLKVEEHERSIEKSNERDKMQDTIINKLNAEYNSKVAQELQEIADINGVGG